MNRSFGKLFNKYLFYALTLSWPNYIPGNRSCVLIERAVSADGSVSAMLSILKQAVTNKRRTGTLPGFYIFFLPGNCLALSNCPVATSAFQNVTRGWGCNACLFDTGSLLTWAPSGISKAAKGKWPVSIKKRVEGVESSAWFQGSGRARN